MVEDRTLLIKYSLKDKQYDFTNKKR